jgi:hypothetical protein
VEGHNLNVSLSIHATKGLIVLPLTDPSSSAVTASDPQLDVHNLTVVQK